MKSRDEEITVTLKGRTPVQFLWNGYSYRIMSVLLLWVYRGLWWAKEERRVYFRVLTQRGVYDIYQNEDGWWIAGEFD